MRDSTPAVCVLLAVLTAVVLWALRTPPPPTPTPATECIGLGPDAIAVLVGITEGRRTEGVPRDEAGLALLIDCLVNSLNPADYSPDVDTCQPCADAITDQVYGGQR